MSNIRLMDIHSALSHIVFAVKQNLEPANVLVKAEWNNNTYLAVEVECYGKDVQMISDRLRHGVLQDSYDYRFKLVHSPTNPEPHEWTWVRAYPDLAHGDGRYK